MCLAIPGQIIEINEKKATVNFGGIKRTVDLSLIDSVDINDYVLVHVGFAIQKVEEEVARETYRLLAEVKKEELEQELEESA